MPSLLVQINESRMSMWVSKLMTLEFWNDLKKQTDIAVVKSMLKWDVPKEYQIKFISKNGKHHIREVKTKSDIALEIDKFLDMNDIMRCEITKKFDKENKK